MEQRRKLRAQVESQKKAIMEKFEQVKKQGSGNVSTHELANMLSVSSDKAPEAPSGVFTVEKTDGTMSAQPAQWKASPAKPTKKTEPKPSEKDAKAAESIGRDKIAMLRKKQNEELLKVLEEEQKREENREKQLSTVTNDAERSRLEKIFGMERARSSQRIVSLSE